MVSQRSPVKVERSPFSNLLQATQVPQQAKGVMSLWDERRRTAIILSATTVVIGGGCAAGVWYYSDSGRKFRDSLWSQYQAYCRVVSSIDSAAGLTSVVLKDLEAFLSSDSDEIPRSVRQLMKLTSTHEFQQAVTHASEAVTTGVLQAVTSHESKGPGVIEVILNKVLSDQGRLFASTVTSKAVKTLVQTVIDRLEQASFIAHPHPAASLRVNGRKESEWEHMLLNFLTNERFMAFTTDCVASFTEAAVGTYLDKTKNVNVYHDILSAAHQHRELVKDLGGHLSSSAATSFVHAVVSAAKAPAYPPPQQPPRWAPEASESRRTAEISDLPVSPPAPLSPQSSDSESTAASTPPLRSVQSTGRPEHEHTEVFAPALVPVSSWPWQQELGVLLSDKNVRRALVDVAGAMSAQSTQAFTVALLHSLAWQLFGSSRGPYPLAMLEAEGRGEAGRGVEGGMGEAAVPLTGEDEKGSAVFVWQARVAGRALIAATCAVAVALHCICTVPGKV